MVKPQTIKPMNITTEANKDISGEERKKGGKVGKMKPMHRKHGGAIPGGSVTARPDRPGRSGTADSSPLTSAGKMSIPAYQRATQPPEDTGGRGRDKP